MLIRFIRKKLKGTTLVEVMVSTIIILTIYLSSSTLILNFAVKRPLSNELKIELTYLSELKKNPQLIMEDDTVRFDRFYIINQHTNIEERNIILIDVGLYTPKDFLIGRYSYIRENPNAYQ